MNWIFFRFLGCPSPMKFLKIVVLIVLCALAVQCSQRPEAMALQDDALPVAQAWKDSAELVIVAPSPTPFILRKPRPRLRRPFDHKKLRVLSLHSINSFFLYDGEEHGLEYELLQLYAKDRGLLIDIITVENYRQMYDSIAEGNFDVAMGTLLVNSALDSIAPFSSTLYTADVILVTSTAPPVKDVPLTNVIHHSPIHFWMRDRDHLSSTASDSLNHLVTEMSKEFALELVARNEYPRLIVDRNDFVIMHSYYPQLQEHSILEKEQPVAFAFNPYSMSLKDNFNAWHASNHRGSDYQYTLQKYRDHSSFIKDKLRYELPIIRKGIISQYDSIIKMYAEKEYFDWKLIAAIIHQESRFRPLTVSPVGAYGLMQLMPSVAKTYKINFKKLSSPDLNIATGTKYFRWIYNHFDKPEYTEEDKIKFSLASYNAGMGHILDAKALAVKYKLNPYVWDDNVELMLLRKSSHKFYTDPVVKYGHCRGYETQVYVRNIMQYYEHYLNFSASETM